MNDACTHVGPFLPTTISPNLYSRRSSPAPGIGRRYASSNSSPSTLADTGPVNCPILIGHIGLLAALFERVILPVAVKSELADPGAGVGRGEAGGAVRFGKVAVTITLDITPEVQAALARQAAAHGPRWNTI